MSVANYGTLMRVLEKYMHDQGVSAESAGVRLNRLVYKTMIDVDADNPTADSYTKNRMTVEVVAAFVANVAKSEQENGRRGIPDMDRRVAEMAASRSDVDIGDPYRDFQRAIQSSVDKTGSSHAALRPDLAGLRKNIGSPCDDGIGSGIGNDATAPSNDVILLPPGRKRVVRRFLLVNGYDRNWNSFPFRFAFTVSLANNDASFKDIRSIAATRLIIPREIVEEKTLTSVPKTRFEQPFNLQYPYLILRIAEFQSVYKASNTASQSAFCHFVYKNHYTSPSGRGYVHLVPAQKEALEFYINPLASLQQMDISIQRPSGALLNTSRDQSRVLRMDWNNQVNMNRQLIMVTLKDFFDRNEFFAGDTVQFKGFDIPSSLTAASLVSFVNRDEGHDILEFGTPNADGYVRTFYIRVPGTFNPSSGLFDVDTSATEELMTYINGIDYDNSPPDNIALVINASLQASLAFEIRVEEEDVTV